MAHELSDFKQRLVAHAKLAATRAERAKRTDQTISEAATNIQLVQPFIALLGYDPTNPDEVSPEHHADFAEKYQNKVDYAILRGGVPVIAIESKKVGTPLKDDRGQLRSYFNACVTVKLGVLTDGLLFEFYADSDKPNMMDDTPFLRLDLLEIAAKDIVDDNLVSALSAIQNGVFNPDNVGAEAKRKLLVESIVSTLKRNKEHPSDEFVHFFLADGTISKIISQKVTKKIIESHRQDVREAIGTFVALVAQEALANFGYAPKDAVAGPTSTTVASAETDTDPGPDNKYIETEPLPNKNEENLFRHVHDRLLFLVRNEVLFNEVSKIKWRKSPTTFRVYYDRPNAGALLNYEEGKGHKYVIRVLVPEEIEISFDEMSKYDDVILQAFRQRVRERGVTF